LFRRAKKTARRANLPVWRLEADAGITALNKVDCGGGQRVGNQRRAGLDPPWAKPGYVRRGPRLSDSASRLPNDWRRVNTRPPEPGSIDPPYARWKPALQSFQVMFGEDRVPPLAL